MLLLDGDEEKGKETMKLIDGVECYGQLEWNSNFQVICQDELYDGIYADGNPDPDPDREGFVSWHQVVAHLKKHYRDDIIELTAC